jgi:hypothetical protein
MYIFAHTFALTNKIQRLFLNSYYLRFYNCVIVMKKVFVLLFATMMVAKSFATEFSAEPANFDLDLNFKQIVSELDLDWEYIPELKAAGKNLEKQVAGLAEVTPEERQEKLSEYVLSNLGSVKAITTDRQYRQYLTLLNREFNESHLNAILFGFDNFEYIAEK